MLADGHAARCHLLSASVEKDCMLSTWWWTWTFPLAPNEISRSSRSPQATTSPSTYPTRRCPEVKEPASVGNACIAKTVTANGPAIAAWPITSIASRSSVVNVTDSGSMSSKTPSSARRAHVVSRRGRSSSFKLIADPTEATHACCSPVSEVSSMISQRLANRTAVKLHVRRVGHLAEYVNVFRALVRRETCAAVHVQPDRVATTG